MDTYMHTHTLRTCVAEWHTALPAATSPSRTNDAAGNLNELARHVQPAMS